MVPLALRLKPAGRAPLVTLHVYPPEPPVAASVWEYAVPTVAPGNDAVVIVSGAVFTVMLSVVHAVKSPLSATEIKKVDVPAAVGVPAIVPEELRFRPGGSAPPISIQLYGGLPPSAWTVWEYAVPTVPLGSEEVVTLSIPCWAAVAMLVSIATLREMLVKGCLIWEPP
jgi:hypothetical protein